jgi:hypothetical protein
MNAKTLKPLYKLTYHLPVSVIIPSLQLQSGRTEAPASTIPLVLQRFQISVYLVQISKSGKYAPGKKVALNPLILSNVEASSARLLKCNTFFATLQYSDVF